MGVVWLAPPFLEGFPWRRIWNQSYHNCRMLPLIFRPAVTERIWWTLGWYRTLVTKDWKSIAIKNIVAKEDVSV